MDKMVVVVFDTEAKAYEGVRALSDLHREGSLTVYSDAVIAKDTNGTVALRQSASIGPVGTLLGGATGALIGLLGGRQHRRRSTRRCGPAGCGAVERS